MRNVYMISQWSYVLLRFANSLFAPDVPLICLNLQIIRLEFIRQWFPVWIGPFLWQISYDGSCFMHPFPTYHQYCCAQSDRRIAVPSHERHRASNQWFFLQRFVGVDIEKLFQTPHHMPVVRGIDLWPVVFPYQRANNADESSTSWRHQYVV